MIRLRKTMSASLVTILLFSLFLSTGAFATTDTTNNSQGTNTTTSTQDAKIATDATLSSLGAKNVSGVTYTYGTPGDIDTVSITPIGESPVVTPLQLGTAFSPDVLHYETTMPQLYPASFAIDKTTTDPNATVTVKYTANPNNVDYDTVKIGIDNCWLSGVPAVGDQFTATITVVSSDTSQTKVYTVTTTVVGNDDATLSSLGAKNVSGVAYTYGTPGDIDTVSVTPIGESPVVTPLPLDAAFSPDVLHYETTMPQLYPASFAIDKTTTDPNATVTVKYTADPNNVDYDTVKIGIDNCWLSGTPAVGDKFTATITVVSSDKSETNVYTVTTTVVGNNPALSSDATLSSLGAKNVSGVTYTYGTPGNIDTVSVTPIGESPVVTPLQLNTAFSPDMLHYETTMPQLYPASFAIDKTTTDPNATVTVKYTANPKNVDYDTVKIGVDNCWLSGMPAVGDQFTATITVVSSDKSQTNVYTVTSTVMGDDVPVPSKPQVGTPLPETSDTFPSSAVVMTLLLSAGTILLVTRRNSKKTL